MFGISGALKQLTTNPQVQALQIEISHATWSRVVLTIPKQSLGGGELRIFTMELDSIGRAVQRAGYDDTIRSTQSTLESLSRDILTRLK
jgi:hypothetical protein